MSACGASSISSAETEERYESIYPFMWGGRRNAQVDSVGLGGEELASNTSDLNYLRHVSRRRRAYLA